MDKVVIACAGSGKTSSLIEMALTNSGRRVLIVTYTTNNYNQILERIHKKAGCVPANIDVRTWFSFLLADGVRPYQNILYPKTRIKSIAFVHGVSNRYAKKSDIEGYYLYNDDLIYTDKICDFICEVNERSDGKVIKRIEGIYDDIYIDEVQDLAGYDLSFLELLFRSNVFVHVVGDCRQATYFTNLSRKYKAFRGKNILSLFKNWEKDQLCEIEYKVKNYRSNQMICDFSDMLFPDFPKSESCLGETTEHDGVFMVRSENVFEYVKLWNPTILKYDKNTSTLGYRSYNFGESKGLTFERVLIFPNGPIKEYLKNNTSLSDITRSKLYVGLTRARHSVAFVYDDDSCHSNIQIYSTT